MSGADGSIGATDDETDGIDVVVPVAEYLDAVGAVLEGSGASRADAREQAELLLEGDLRGHASHGARRLPTLVERLRAGLIVTDPPIRVDWRSESFALIDGGDGFGAVVARAAVDAVVDRAEHTGVAVAGVRRANHIGMLAPHVERIAARGHLGIALTTSEALVHPWGGARALVGTNPIGIAVPTPDHPLVLDMSTGAVSMGRILDHLGMDRPLPAGWAVDADGRPTSDAAAATRGAISPFGGPKGFALGLALEVVVAALSATALGTGVHGTLDTDRAVTKGDVFIAVSLRRLGLETALPAIRDYLDEVRASGVDASAPVTVPGDRSREVRARHLAAGVPVHRSTWDRTLELLDEVAVPVPARREARDG